MDSVRQLIDDEIKRRGESLSAVSLRLGKNHAYMQQFLKRGIPAELPEHVRIELAQMLNLPEVKLRGPLTSSTASEPILPNARMGGPRPMTQTIPVYGQAMGGKDGKFILNGNKIADILAPPVLAGVPNAYAVYVVGDSMEDRYRAGEAVYVNPRLPVRRGDYVVAQIAADEEGEPPFAYVKRFVGLDAKLLKLEQLQPKKTLEFPADRVVSVHKIILGGEG